MNLPDVPPHYAKFSDIYRPIKKGEGPSWRVYALQKGLIARGHILVANGVFNDTTLGGVKLFQKNNGLVVDGIVGPFTQHKLLWKVSRKLEQVKVSNGLTAPGIIYGICMRETSGLLAPVNEYDPSEDDQGADLGPLQWRVAGPPYSMQMMLFAFDPLKVMDAGMNNPDMGLLPRIAALRKRQPDMSGLLILRVAIVAHNAPFLYGQYLRNGKLAAPEAIAEWTDNGSGGHFTHQEHVLDYSSDVLTFAINH